MIGPAKNRLHDYEAGWLTLLIEMGVATRAEAEAAMNRVAQAAIDEIGKAAARADAGKSGLNRLAVAHAKNPNRRCRTSLAHRAWSRSSTSRASVSSGECPRYRSAISRLPRARSVAYT
jgi:hypothetical protein